MKKKQIEYGVYKEMVSLEFMMLLSFGMPMTESVDTIYKKVKGINKETQIEEVKESVNIDSPKPENWAFTEDNSRYFA